MSCRTNSHPYDIEHRRTRGCTPQINGFVERFQRTALKEFLVETLRRTFHETVEALPSDLDRWLVYYNTQRPHHGYRNLGVCPIHTVERFSNTVLLEG